MTDEKAMVPPLAVDGETLQLLDTAVDFRDIEEFSVVVFVMIFKKSEKEDISSSERNDIKRLLDEVRGELEKGPKRG